MRNIFLEKSCRKWGKVVSENEVVPDIFLFFKNTLHKIKATGQQLLLCFGRSRLGHTLKKLYNTSDCWCRDMLNFDSL